MGPRGGTRRHRPQRRRRCFCKCHDESPRSGENPAPEGVLGTECRRKSMLRRHFLAGGPLSYGIPSGPLAPASFRRQSALLGSRREDTRTGTGPMPAPVAGTRWDRSKKDASPDDASPQRRDKGTVPLSHSGKGACSTAGRVRSSREGGTSRPAWSADRHHISSCVRPRSCRSS